jgi:flagellar biosynthesis protein FlhB
MSETAGEKTFAPTQKRRDDAARKGDVLRSRELATAASVLAGLGWMVMAGPWLFEELFQLVTAAFVFDRSSAETLGADGVIARLPWVFAPVVVLGLLVPAASMTAQLAFGEGRWVGENIAFKGSRINPLSGLKRMFGMQGLIEIGKGLLKVTLLGAIAAYWIMSVRDELAGLSRATLDHQLQVAWDSLVTLFAALGVGLVVIAGIDLPIQWLRRNQRLMMSLQEMKDENKESEGSPETKAARRQRQRDIATGALGPAMREAQFVITNPAHFSVALAYDPAKASAPVVVAKGRGDKALAIRELAAEYALPVLEYPPLARSLYYTTRERQMIREELYTAVAAIVAFVLSVRRGEPVPRPVVSVPVNMQFDAEGRQRA